MGDTVRFATRDDAAAIAHIYNQGIAEPMSICTSVMKQSGLNRFQLVI